MYEDDERTVMTLDAGGTNMVFSAIKGNRQVVKPIRIDTVSDDLDQCLNTMKYGFEQVKESVDTPPVAISFAFPGPADYPNGVIGDLPNFPAFRGGVPLGPILEDWFHIPVYMENDGNLFAFGEATSGMLPRVNDALRKAGNKRTYHHLIGITIGTGFGCGVVIDGHLLTGDNGCGGDVWLSQNAKYPDLIAEESVSKRAVVRVYGEKAGINSCTLTPKDIFDIAEGTRDGNQLAAKESFAELGKVAGVAIAHALDMIDGIVVIGGGIAGASHYILPSMLEVLRGKLAMMDGQLFDRVEMKVFNWEDRAERNEFLNGHDQEVVSPISGRKVPYHSVRRTIIAVSEDGASTSTMKGAYAFALMHMDHQS